MAGSSAARPSPGTTRMRRISWTSVAGAGNCPRPGRTHDSRHRQRRTALLRRLHRCAQDPDDRLRRPGRYRAQPCRCDGPCMSPRPSGNLAGASGCASYAARAGERTPSGRDQPPPNRRRYFRRRRRPAGSCARGACSGGPDGLRPLEKPAEAVVARVAAGLQFLTRPTRASKTTRRPCVPAGC